VDKSAFFVGGEGEIYELKRALLFCRDPSFNLCARSGKLTLAELSIISFFTKKEI